MHLWINIRLLDVVQRGGLDKTGNKILVWGWHTPYGG